MILFCSLLQPEDDSDSSCDSEIQRLTRRSREKVC